MSYQLSVIIPAYNSEKTLPETLDSLLGQSVNPEIIVVNDGSTDGTRAVAESYALKHPEIKVINKENGGVSRARNTGLENATGKYIIFLDADDLLQAGTISAVIKAMEKNDADAGVYRLMRFGFGGNEYNPIVEKIVKQKVVPVFDKSLMWTYLVGNKCFRASLLREYKIEFPLTKYSEDGVFWMSFLMRANPKVIGIPGGTVRYRRSDPALNLTVSQSMRIDLVKDFFTSVDMIEKEIIEGPGKRGIDKGSQKGYLDEFRYKVCFTCINEFYRKLWSADEEALSLLEEGYNRYYQAITGDSKNRLLKDFPEIGKPVFSRKEVAGNPVFSIICRKPTDAFLGTLYNQSMVSFELVTSDKKLRGVKANITDSPKGKYKLKFSGKKAIDPRILRAIFLLKNSKTGFLPVFVLKYTAVIYLKIKDNKSR